MTVVLFWDIDGTLLSTGRAGIFALEDAAREVCGAELDFSGLPTAGLTDHQIAEVVVRAAGATPDEETVRAFVAVYERSLPERLHARRGRVMPGVEELLAATEDRPDVLSLLLTGNTAAGAAAKLHHYGLDRYLGAGAFSMDTGERSEIARRALALATERIGRAPAPAETYVIGDTPHDVICGKAIGARTVAVATGTFALPALEECEPWWALEELPPLEVFLERVGLGRQAA
jgi:phosphoglycolate phosphatase-like HAD superfamily hydrolase